MGIDCYDLSFFRSLPWPTRSNPQDPTWTPETNSAQAPGETSLLKHPGRTRKFMDIYTLAFSMAERLQEPGFPGPGSSHNQEGWVLGVTSAPLQQNTGMLLEIHKLNSKQWNYTILRISTLNTMWKYFTLHQSVEVFHVLSSLCHSITIWKFNLVIYRSGLSLLTGGHQWRRNHMCRRAKMCPGSASGSLWLWPPDNFARFSIVLP